tara:strand:- start:1016 stop:2005 length:990 start_codon:yes stop_codon:yes gene_type:complete
MIEYYFLSDLVKSHVSFPLSSYEELLIELNFSDIDQWINTWNLRGGSNLAASSWPQGTKKDWLWGLGLPFLTDIERYLQINEERIIFGISGLPGCGKTSLGKWIESAALELNWAVKVISLDDFYLPSKELDEAMAGNPWRVPRGLPGSHSIQLLKDTIQTWKTTGLLKSPHFDKALRNGKGDRSGWSVGNPEILIIEGWFLGCQLTNNITNSMDDLLVDIKPITSIEKDYQFVVQRELKKYQPIWDEFERIWHLKAIDFLATKNWKTQQESNLQRERGASLQGEDLDLFHRMVQTSIPLESIQSVKSDVIVKLNESRQIKWVGLSNQEK